MKYKTVYVGIACSLLFYLSYGAKESFTLPSSGGSARTGVQVRKARERCGQSVFDIADHLTDLSKEIASFYKNALIMCSDEKESVVATAHREEVSGLENLLKITMETVEKCHAQLSQLNRRLFPPEPPRT